MRNLEDGERHTCWPASRSAHVKSTEAHGSEEIRCGEFGTDPGGLRTQLSGRGQSFGSNSQNGFEWLKDVPMLSWHFGGHL